MSLKSRLIEIAYKLKDQFTGQVGKITGGFRKIEKASDKTAKKIDRDNRKSTKSFKGLAGGLTPVRAAFVAVGAVIGGLVASISKWTAAANVQERAETKLATSLRNLTGASEEQIKALREQASQLQKITGYGDEVTLSAQAMLATFQLNAGQIQQLTPLLLDMAESARKAGKAEVDLESISIALGKAFTSGIGALSRYGVAMTDAQKEAFKLADQQGKVNILTEVLKGNFEGLAEAVGSTYEGAVRKAEAAQGDASETLGQIFTKSKSWVKLTGVLTNAWDSLAKGVKGSSKEIRVIVSALAITITTVVSTIRVAWNSLQIVFKVVALSMVQSAANINEALAKISFGKTSKDFKDKAAELRRYAEDLRDGIGEDVADIVDSFKSFTEALEDTGDEVEETTPKVKKLGSAAKDATQDFKSLEQANKNLEKSFGNATKEYEKNAQALQRVKDNAKTTSDEFQALIAEMRGSIEEEAENLDLIDLSGPISDARRALADGDYDQAIDGARKAGEMLRKMKEEGAYADIVLTGMAMRIKQLADEALKAQQADPIADLDESKASLDELIKKKQDLESGPINLRVEVDQTQFDQFKPPKEIVIPVRYEVIGGIPSYGDGTSITDSVRRESDKGGYRP